MATVTSVLDHCPADVGEILDCSPIQIEVGPIKLMGGSSLTVNGADCAEEHPVTLLVKMNLADPALTAVITPLSCIVATDSFVLAQVPPELGVIFENSPIQSSVSDNPPIGGGPYTAMVIDSSETQPFVDSTKVKVALPTEFPVTTPELFTLATELLLLIQIPPEVGDNVVVVLTQISDGPRRVTTGFSTTVIGVESSFVHPALEIKEIVVFPPLTPVITPVELIVAMDTFEEDHVPLSDALT